MTTELTHFIAGKHVAGTSGRSADVFDPNTGSVQATVPLASVEEVTAVIDDAEQAQREWAAWNPQRRARVLMKFLRLVERDMDELAEQLSREHGKTLPDARGDIQRGVEVIEFALGTPHLLKGEYTEGAGTGIDVYSMRQPLGVVAGITPFNFPAMIPLWKAGPALAAATPSSSSRPSATRRCRCASPSCSSRPACRQASSRSSTATRRPSTPSCTTTASRPSASSARPRHRPVHLLDRRRERQARAVLRRRQEPHDRDARRRSRPGRRRPDRRRLRLRRRALHGDHRGGAGRRGDRRRPVRQAHRARQDPAVGHSLDPTSTTARS